MIRFTDLQGIILEILMRAPDNRLQRRIIVEESYGSSFVKEKRYGKNTLNVMLHRDLNRLVNSGYLKKNDVGHKNVYYYIPKRRKPKIAEYLEDRFQRKMLDDFWNALTPEQRKKWVQAFIRQQQIMIKPVLKNLGKLRMEIRDWIEQLISDLENPNAYTKQRYSSKERRELLEKLSKEKDKIEKEEKEEKQALWKPNYEEYRQFLMHFQTIFKLIQDGDAIILTKRQLEKLRVSQRDLTSMPIPLYPMVYDKESLRRLGVKENVIRQLFDRARKKM